MRFNTLRIFIHVETKEQKSIQFKLLHVKMIKFILCTTYFKVKQSWLEIICKKNAKCSKTDWKNASVNFTLQITNEQEYNLNAQLAEGR